MRTRTSFVAMASAVAIASTVTAQTGDRPMPAVPAPTPAASPEGTIVERTATPVVGLPADFEDGPLVLTGEHFLQPAQTEFTGVSDAELLASNPASPDLSNIHDRLHFGVESDGIWVRGRTFKARAGESGFAYVPFLGSHASRNYPVEMSVAAARVGGVELPVAGAAAVSRVGDSLLLDRGPVEARYDVELEQVEQILFVDTGRLIGDLVVTLDVATDLVPAPNGGGFLFEGPEGSVAYSAAIALDGAGGSIEVSAALEGGELRLTVPAAFVAQCAGRVVIDPIVSTYDVDTFSADLTDPDASYDAGTDDFAFAYEEDFSEVDTDIYFSVVSSQGVGVDAGYAEVGLNKFVDPEVANLNSSDVFLIVATDEVAAGDDPIMGRIYDIATQGFPNPIFEIGNTTNSGAATWTNARPDVGGNSSTAAGTEFCVVWEREFTSGDVAPRFRTVAADGTLGSQQFINNNDAEQVRISESTGDPSVTNVWNVVYASIDGGSGDEEIRGFQLNADGSINQSDSSLRIVGSDVIVGLDVSDALDLDGLAPTYVAVYDEFGTTQRDVDAVVLRANSFVNQFDVNLLEHAIATDQQNDPKIATTEEDFVISYTESQGGQWTTHVTCLDLTEASFLAVSERRLPLTPTTPQILEGAGMASRWSGGLNSRWVGLAWENFDGTDYDIVGATVFASNAQSPAWQYCDGVANSTGERGFIRLGGDRSATSNKEVFASGLPPQQFSLLIAGSGFGNVPMAGGEGTLCLGGVLGRFNSMISPIDVDGTVEFNLDPQQIPAGGVLYSAFVGDFYQFQVWHRDFVGFQTSNYTNAVTILWN